jgi:hypothetical protein
MNFPSALLERLDLEVAIEQAVPARGEFFPGRLEAKAAQEEGAAYAAWIEAQLREGYGREAPGIVLVPRGSPGYRPVPDLPFFDRVVFEALTGLLAQELVDDLERLGLRSFFVRQEGDRRAFERLPIESESADFVIQADVASFYEYVDHARLRSEIVELTADVELADALDQLLAEAVDRQFGLPQGPRASDVLADVYLAPIDQQLDQAGIESWRYNDDFLLAGRNRQHSRLLLQELESALRERGLVLNHAKNRISDRDTYEGWVDTLTQRLQDAAIANVDPNMYSFDPETFADVEIDDLDIPAIEDLFTQAIDDEERDPYKVNPRILQQTLPILAKAESQLPLERLTELAMEWGSHARHVSLYLREFIGGEGEEAMVSKVAAVLDEQPNLVPWVRGWLLDPLTRCSRPTNREGLETKLVGWLGSEGEPWFSRGRCALVLAQRKRIWEQAEFHALFQRAVGPARADLIASVRLAEPEWSSKWLRAAGNGDPLLRKIAAWSLEGRPDVL